MPLSFGLRVPAVGRPQHTADFARRLESAGLDFMWMPDTPLLAGLWRDVYLHLACAAMATAALRLGPGVTTLVTRHPVTTASLLVTLDELSDGRADLVAGTGYSSAHVIGEKPGTLAAMAAATRLWRGIFRGERTDLGGLEIALPARRPRLPIYLAATGPRMLELAGEIADGVLIYVGVAPGAVRWALDRVEAGMRRAGRRRQEVRRIVVAEARIDADKPRAIDHMRPCVARLYRQRHLRELTEAAGLPPLAPPPGPLPRPYPDLAHPLDWEEARRATAFIPDALVDAMVLAGPGEEVAERVRGLAALDIDAIWWRDEASYARPEALLAALSGAVLPRLR